MPYSPESLQAFVEAAALGSFSAAARRLRKTSRQSVPPLPTWKPTWA